MKHLLLLSVVLVLFAACDKSTADVPNDDLQVQFHGYSRLNLI